MAARANLSQDAPAGPVQRGWAAVGGRTLDIWEIKDQHGDLVRFPLRPRGSVGEGGAKRRMRAGARERDGGASGRMHDRASGNTAPLRYAALIRPSGTFSHAARGRRGTGRADARQLRQTAARQSANWARPRACSISFPCRLPWIPLKGHTRSTWLARNGKPCCAVVPVAVPPAGMDRCLHPSSRLPIGARSVAKNFITTAPTMRRPTSPFSSPPTLSFRWCSSSRSYGIQASSPT